MRRSVLLSVLSVCVCVCNGRAMSEPYYSHHALSVCVSLSAFFQCCCQDLILGLETETETWTK